jgi:hypothetical protein
MTPPKPVSGFPKVIVPDICSGVADRLEISHGLAPEQSFKKNNLDVLVLCPNLLDKLKPGNQTISEPSLAKVEISLFHGFAICDLNTFI